MNFSYLYLLLLNITADEFSKGSKSFIMVTENCMDYTVAFESESAPILSDETSFIDLLATHILLLTLNQVLAKQS